MAPLTSKSKNQSSSRKLSFDEIEKMLISFSTSVLKENTVEGVYWNMAKNVIAKLQFVDCVIYSVDPKRKLLVQEAAYGPKSPRNNEVNHPLSIALGIGITGSVASTDDADRDKKKNYAQRLSNAIAILIT